MRRLLELVELPLRFAYDEKRQWRDGISARSCTASIPCSLARRSVVVCLQLLGEPYHVTTKKSKRVDIPL